MPRRLGLLFACSLMLLALLSSCTRRETVVQRGNREQILHLGNGAEPSSLDPHVLDAYSDQRLEAALFEGLCVIDEQTSKPAPGAAERWEVAANGLTWTFHLRPGLQWSNGEPLTADDFVQSWRRNLTPSFASAYAYLLFPIKNAESFNNGKITDPGALGLATPDARTIIITLERPTAYLPVLTANAAWHPINPRVVMKFGPLTERASAWTRPGNLVGNGPFLLQEWTPGSRIVVAKNPRYWDAPAVRLNGMVFYPIENPDVEERNFRAGQLHLTNSLPLSKIPAYRQQDSARLRTDLFLQILFLRFNVTKPPFDNPRIRRALALAIDRESISRNLLHGSRAPAEHFVPPQTAGYDSRARVARNLAEARRLLAEAGHPGGQGLPVLELQVRNDEIQPKMVEAVQAMWQQELGVRISIAQLEQKVSIQNQTTLNFTIGSNGWVADFADPVTFLDLFVSGGGNNWTGWGNPAYDQLITAAGQTIDPTERYELFQQAEALLLEEAPVIPLVFGARNYLIDPAVRGWEPAALGMYQYKKIYLQGP
ncbi:MAG: peptide ABC transporter substrate-binding protein [Opitutae bacterium]